MYLENLQITRGFHCFERKRCTSSYYPGEECWQCTGVNFPLQSESDSVLLEVRFIMRTSAKPSTRITPHRTAIMTQNRVREMVPSNRNKEKLYFVYKYFALKRQTNVVVFIYALKPFQNVNNDRPKSEIDW